MQKPSQQRIQQQNNILCSVRIFENYLVLMTSNAELSKLVCRPSQPSKQDMPHTHAEADICEPTTSVLLPRVKSTTPTLVGVFTPKYRQDLCSEQR